jgi:hypothetical protein
MDRTRSPQQEATAALVKLAVLEVVALLAVVGLYLMTGNVLHLVLGLGVVSVLFAPLFVRRVLDLRAAQDEGPAPEDAPAVGAAGEPPPGPRWE